MKVRTTGARLALLVAGTAILLTACTSKTELMRRYDKVEAPAPGAADPSIRVGVFTVAKPGSQPKGLLDLSDRGQESYIGAVGAKAKNLDEIRVALAKSFKAPPGPDADLGRISRRLVFSVMDQGFGPADRLERLEVAVKLLNDRSANGQQCGGAGRPDCTDITFTSWSLFATQYGEVDLGKATLTKSQSLEGTVKATVPQIRELGEISVTPKISRDLKEELAVRQRFVALAGEITPTTFTVLQQGATGIDLIGTSQVDVSLDLGARSFQWIYRFKNGTTAALSSARRLNPTLVCDVRVNVTAHYRLRKVIDGDETSIEGDDKVRFVSDVTTTKPYTLMEAADIGDRGFVLRQSGAHELHVLRPGRPDTAANHEPLTFASSDNATAFLLWLQGAATTTAPPVSGHRFKVRDGGGTRGVRDVTASEAAAFYVVPPPRRRCHGT